MTSKETPGDADSGDMELAALLQFIQIASELCAAINSFLELARRLHPDPATVIPQPEEPSEL